MPEHVHLLVYPTVSEPDIDRLLAAIKRPFSFRVSDQQIVDPDLPTIHGLPWEFFA